MSLSIISPRPSRISSLFVAFSLSLTPAFAAFYDAPGARLEAMVGVREDFDSNIFLNSNDVEDYITTFSGTLKLVRDVALIKSELSLTGAGSMYANHSDENSFDPRLHGRFVFTPSDKTTVAGGFGYSRSSIANETLNARTRSNDFDLNGSLQSLFSEKLGYRASGTYKNHKYLTDGYADVLSYSAGVDAVYVYSPKLTLLGGYGHRESWTENRGKGSANPASSDATVSVAAEGELAPKVSGTVRIGWVKRSLDSASFADSSALFLSTGLKWVPAQKTAIAIDASQDFDTTAANQSSKVASFSFGVTQTIDQRWSCDANIAYSHSVYAGGSVGASRTDDNFRIRGRLNYAIAENLSLEFALGYGNVDSTIDFSSYDRVSAGVGVSASF